MSAVPDARPAGSAEAAPAIGAIRLLWRRTATLSLLELAKLRHDRTELYTRAVQPALWLLVFGETFSRIHAIPTSGRLPYLDYLAPGIMAQSALFIAIFYGIQLIWERDFGILTKLLATPTPRAALVAGKAFAAGVRAVSQVLVVLILASILGVRFVWRPLGLLGAVVAVMLGSSFFASLSITIAGLVRTCERLMGIGQAITMPLFFASNALYPTEIDARLDAGRHPRQPAQLRGQRPPAAAARPPRQPRRGLRGPAGRRRGRDRCRLPAARAAGPLSAPNGAGLQAGPFLIAPARAGSPAGVAGCRSTAR